MKRILSLFLSVMLALGCFAACEDSSSSGSDATASSDPSAEASTDTDSTASTGTQEFSSAEEVLDASDHYIGLCDQGNSRVIIRDLSVEDWSDDNGVVWEFKHKYCSSVCGIKFRDVPFWGGKVVVLCYHGGAMIVSYESRQLLFHTGLTGSNPHSVELLPNGTLIVASSTDNDVRIYAPGEQKASQIVEFPNAHGVLWDPTYEVVWMVGTNLLGAYLVGGTEEAPTLSAIGGMSYKTPKSGMHDLAASYSDPTKLFVTCGNGIMIFDKESEKFSFEYPGGVYGKQQNYAPGCGAFGHDDVFVFTTIRESTMVLNEWCTDQVFIYCPFGKNGKLIKRRAEGDAYYKLRVLNFDYQ